MTAIREIKEILKTAAVCRLPALLIIIYGIYIPQTVQRTFEGNCIRLGLGLDYALDRKGKGTTNSVVPQMNTRPLVKGRIATENGGTRWSESPRRSLHTINMIKKQE